MGASATDTPMVSWIPALSGVSDQSRRRQDGAVTLRRRPDESSSPPKSARGQQSSDALGDAERGLGIIFILVRGGTLIPMLVGSSRGLEASPRPVAYGALTLGASAFVVAMSVAVWRRSAIPAGWGRVDLLVAVVAMLGCAALLPASEQLGSWAAWGSGFAVGTAAATGAWCRSLPMVLAASGLLAVCYASALVWSGSTNQQSILGNAATYPILAVISMVYARYLRSMGSRADEMRDRALRATRQVELDRYRLMVHDITGILWLLGDPKTPTELLPALRKQATSESTRLRAYLSESLPTDPCTSGHWTLGTAVSSAVEGFEDLPLEISLDLGALVPLTEGDALALQRAVATTLHNVRRHAAARQVVVHADTTDTEWELVIRDDGDGFDSAGTALGFGLRVQVISELDKRGIAASVDATPGNGTAVTIRGALSHAGE